MSHKAKKITVIVLVAILAVFLLVQGGRIGYDLYRELTFYDSPRSDAELAVMALPRKTAFPTARIPKI